MYGLIFSLVYPGIGGILQAYAACVPVVQLYGPTNFAPIIYHVIQFATAAQRENNAKVSYHKTTPRSVITKQHQGQLSQNNAKVSYHKTTPRSVITKQRQGQLSQNNAKVSYHKTTPRSVITKQLQFYLFHSTGKMAGHFSLWGKLTQFSQE